MSEFKNVSLRNHKNVGLKVKEAGHSDSVKLVQSESGNLYVTLASNSDRKPLEYSTLITYNVTDKTLNVPNIQLGGEDTVYLTNLSGKSVHTPALYSNKGIIDEVVVSTAKVDNLISTNAVINNLKSDQIIVGSTILTSGTITTPYVLGTAKISSHAISLQGGTSAGITVPYQSTEGLTKFSEPAPNNSEVKVLTLENSTMSFVSEKNIKVSTASEALHAAKSDSSDYSDSVKAYTKVFLNTQYTIPTVRTNVGDGTQLGRISTSGYAAAALTVSTKNNLNVKVENNNMYVSPGDPNYNLILQNLVLNIPTDVSFKLSSDPDDLDISASLNTDVGTPGMTETEEPGVYTLLKALEDYRVEKIYKVLETPQNESTLGPEIASSGNTLTYLVGGRNVTTNSKGWSASGVVPDGWTSQLEVPTDPNKEYYAYMSYRVYNDDEPEEAYWEPFAEPVLIQSRVYASPKDLSDPQLGAPRNVLKFDFTIPRGLQGEKGDQGIQGPKGDPGPSGKSALTRVERRVYAYKSCPVTMIANKIKDTWVFNRIPKPVGKYWDLNNDTVTLPVGWSDTDQLVGTYPVWMTQATYTAVFYPGQEPILSCSEWTTPINIISSAKLITIYGVFPKDATQEYLTGTLENITNITYNFNTNTISFNYTGDTNTSWNASSDNCNVDPQTEAVWMSQASFNNYGQLITEWSVPQRITGADGINGKDADEIEFVYCLSTVKLTDAQLDDLKKSLSCISTSTKLSGSATKNGYTWTNHPQGISLTTKYEYCASREITHTPNEDGKTYDTNYKTFGTPFLWSNWGETGIDGDGIEYIYKVSSGTSIPKVCRQNPNNKHYYYLYTLGTNKYAIYCGTDENNLVSPMKDDTNLELIKQLWNSKTTEFIPDGWTDNPSGVTEDNQYEYVASRKYNGANGYYEPFSKPSLWAKWGEKGEKGEAGKDAPGIQYSYFLSPILLGTSETDTNYKKVNDLLNGAIDETTGVPNSTCTITIGTGTEAETFDDLKWTNHPTGISQEMPYEYVSVRNQILQGTSLVWQGYSNPVLWSSYGETGQDGDGVEYIFTVTTADTAPTLDTSDHLVNSEEYQQNEYLPKNWIDDVPALGTHVKLNKDNEPENKVYSNFIWVASRKYRFQGEGANYRGKKYGWQRFTAPKLWAKVPEPGKDSDSVEFVYHTSLRQIETWPNLYIYYLSQSINELLVGSTQVDFAGDKNFDKLTWTNNPSGVSIDNQYEYVSQRSISYENKLDTTNGGYTLSTNYGTFSNPVLYARYGADGATTEYKYKVFNSASDNFSGWTGEGELTDWFSTPLTVNSTNPYQYITSRVTGGNWSIPVLWNYHPKDGSGVYTLDLDNENICIALQKNGDFYNVASGMNIGTSGICAIGGSGVELSIGTVVLKSNDEKTTICTSTNSKKIDTTSATIDSKIKEYLTDQNISKITLSTKEVSVTYSTSTDITTVSPQFFKLFADINVTENGQTRVVSSVRTLKVTFQVPGDNGVSPTIYELLPSANAICIGTDGTRTPNNISISLKKVTGDNITISETIPTGYSVSYSTNNNSSFLSIKTASIGSNIINNSTGLNINLHKGDSASENTIIDTEYIPFVSDGQQGQKGNPGESPTITSSQTLYRVWTDGSTPPPINENEAKKWTMIVDYLIGIPFKDQYVWAWTRTTYSDGETTDAFSVTRGGRNENVVVCEVKYYSTNNNFSETTVRGFSESKWSFTLSTIAPGDYIWAKQDTKYYNAVKLSTEKICLASKYQDMQSLRLATKLSTSAISGWWSNLDSNSKNNFRLSGTSLSEKDIYNTAYTVSLPGSTNVDKLSSNVNKYLNVIVEGTDLSSLNTASKFNVHGSNQFALSSVSLEELDTVLQSKNIKYRYTVEPVKADGIPKIALSNKYCLITLQDYAKPEYVSNTTTSYSVTRVGADGDSGTIHVAYITEPMNISKGWKLNDFSLDSCDYNSIKLSTGNLILSMYNGSTTDKELKNVYDNLTLSTSTKNDIKLKLGFSTTPVDGALYMGVYTNNISGSSSEDSQNPGAYTWTKISVVEVNTKDTYCIGGSSDTYPTGKTWYDTIQEAKAVSSQNVGCYLWTKTVKKYSDCTSKTTYSVSRIKSPIIYPAGEWSNNKVYQWSEEKNPYILYNNEYWVLTLGTRFNKNDHTWTDVAIGTGYKWNGSNVNTASDNITGCVPVDNSPYWTKMEQFDALYAKVLIAENGTVGQAVFNNNYMFSQEGINLKKSVEKINKDANVYELGNITDTKFFETTTNYSEFNSDQPYKVTNKFIPNVTLDFKTGEAWFARGNVHFGANGLGEMGRVTLNQLPLKNPLTISTNNINLYKENTKYNYTFAKIIRLILGTTVQISENTVTLKIGNNNVDVLAAVITYNNVSYYLVHSFTVKSQKKYELILFNDLRSIKGCFCCINIESLCETVFFENLNEIIIIKYPKSNLENQTYENLLKTETTTFLEEHYTYSKYKDLNVRIYNCNKSQKSIKYWDALDQPHEIYLCSNIFNDSNTTFSSSKNGTKTTYFFETSPKPSNYLNLNIPIIHDSLSDKYSTISLSTTISSESTCSVNISTSFDNSIETHYTDPQNYCQSFNTYIDIKCENIILSASNNPSSGIQSTGGYSHLLYDSSIINYNVPRWVKTQENYISHKEFNGLMHTHLSDYVIYND